MLVYRTCLARLDTKRLAWAGCMPFAMETDLLPTRTPDVINAVSQRSLFRWWDRRRLESALPPVSALADESVTPLLGECIYYQVVRSRPEPDFLATSHGSDVHPLFGQRLVG